VEVYTITLLHRVFAEGDPATAAVRRTRHHTQTASWPMQGCELETPLEPSKRGSAPLRVAFPTKEKMKRLETHTGFPPGFFFVSKTCHDALAGRTTDFLYKKSSDFSGEIFRERNFGSSITAQQLCSHYLALEWIDFPRIRTFVEKRFHGLFSKKKRSKSFVSKKRTRSGSNFPPEWATNSSRSISRHYWMT